jgi:uncharacterized protein YchJ
MYKIKIRYSEYIVHHNDIVVDVFTNEKEAVSFLAKLNQKVKSREIKKIMVLEKRYQNSGRNGK